MTKVQPLFLLIDGTYADRDSCGPDSKGVLKHKNGTPLALDGDGKPMTLAGGAVDNMNVEAAKTDPGATTISIQPSTAVPATAEAGTELNPAPAEVKTENDTNEIKGA